MLPFSPLSHLIALGLVAWLGVMFGRVAPERDLRAARLSVLAVLLGWILASSAIAYRGLYLRWNAEYLLVVAGTLAPLVLVSGLAAVSPRVRRLFAVFLERISLESLTSVHVVRVLAIGTLYKWLSGALPGHFIVPVGIPDFLIGLTALPMSWRVAKDPRAYRRLFTAWNLIGAGAYLLAVPLIQLSQPGPLHLFSGGARTDEVLSFPMSIVPTFIAPVLLAIHVASLVKVRWHQTDSSGRSSGGGA